MCRSRTNSKQELKAMRKRYGYTHKIECHNKDFYYVKELTIKKMALIGDN